MGVFETIEETVDTENGPLRIRVLVNDDGTTESIVELDDEAVVRRVMQPHDNGGRVEVEFMGPWARDENHVSLRLADGTITGTALGRQIGPVSHAELEAEMVTVQTTPRPEAHQLQEAAERIAARVDALASEDAAWKLPKPGCKFCTAKCSAIGVACVAGCAATGPLAHVCAAGCAAAGIDCVTSCPCD